MGETGKRSRSQKGNDGDGKNYKRRAADQGDQSNDELVVYRILCPDEAIGSVIGKSGKIINSIRQETKAKVKVVDPFPGAKDRVLTIYSYIKEKKNVDIDEELTDREPLCAAQDALLRVHTAISNAVAFVGDADKKAGAERKRKDWGECQLLVPSSQSAGIIGKAGATIRNLRSKTKANIRVTAKDASNLSHSCALEFDNFLSITGDSDAVKKALFAVSAIMYKFTPKENVPLDTSIPEAPPSIFIPSDVPIYPATGLYPSGDPIVPSRSVPSVLGVAHTGYADSGSTLPVYSSALPVVSGYGGEFRYEELTIKVLCPYSKIGRVIGRGGSSIKSVRQASGARVDVDDKNVGDDDCVITVISKESVDDSKSMAVEAVLLLQEKISDEDEDHVTIRLLVPSKVIGCIIGKSGSIINEIRKRTRAEIHISKGDKPKRADTNEELVEVAGEVINVRDALIQIVLRLRDDVLNYREEPHNLSTSADPGYPTVGARPLHSVLENIGLAPPQGYEHRDEPGSGFGMLSSGSLHGYNSLTMGDDVYGSLPSYSSKVYGGFPPPSTLEMVVPAHAVGKVMGKGGSNIENIRKISGAAVEISDSKSSRGDRVALISGTAEQKRAAENLIQAFILAT